MRVVASASWEQEEDGEPPVAGPQSPGRPVTVSGQGGARWEGVQGVSGAGVGRGGTGLAAPMGTGLLRTCSEPAPVAPVAPVAPGLSAAGPTPAPSGAQAGGVPSGPAVAFVWNPSLVQDVQAHLCLQKFQPFLETERARGDTAPGETPVVNAESAGAVDSSRLRSPAPRHQRASEKGRPLLGPPAQAPLSGQRKPGCRPSPAPGHQPPGGGVGAEGPGLQGHVLLSSRGKSSGSWSRVLQGQGPGTRGGAGLGRPTSRPRGSVHR